MNNELSLPYLSSRTLRISTARRPLVLIKGSRAADEDTKDKEIK
jgi:hypothetical protein